MASTPRAEPSFTLGFNFDPRLIDGIARLNRRSPRIREVFGAIPGSPISSARPTSRLPTVDMTELRQQVSRLDSAGVAFNYLMNTRQSCSGDRRVAVAAYLRRLHRIGVRRLTVGTPELCSIVRDTLPSAHVTMSITRGIRTRRRLDEAIAAGADAAYLDGVFVNRDFALLRSLVGVREIESKLYANMSCVAACPVVRRHYETFAGPQKPDTAARSDAFFAGCSYVKLRSPVEWIQMPWIRPEDIDAYVAEGVTFFKVSDRLAPTDVLLRIAGAYVRGESPPNMFELMDRDGVKYRTLLGDAPAPARPPISVWSRKIPHDFVEHFRTGDCRSRDVDCRTCASVARAAVEVDPEWQGIEPPPEVAESMPAALRRRVLVAG
jgi:hypothetical protein